MIETIYCYKCIFYCKKGIPIDCTHYKEFTPIERTLCKLEYSDLEIVGGTAKSGSLREKLIMEYWEERRKSILVSR